MAYVKPQVLVFQEFTIVPTEITEPLRAHISGPHAALHRYSNSAEKMLSKLGVYNPDANTTYAWPQRTAGSTIDLPYTKVFIDDALLNYYEQLIDDPNTVTKSVDGKTNWIESVAGTGPNPTAVYYKTNGASARSPAFADRDVKIGDVVYLRAVSTDGNCTPTTFWTSVKGFATQQGSSAIANATRDTSNAAYSANTTYSATWTKTGGVNNDVTIASVNGTGYNGTIDGVISETYTVEVIANPTPGCINTTALRVRSSSKLDDVAVVYHPQNFGDAVAIGTRGLLVTFTNAAGSSSSSSATPDTFVIGQTWSISVTQAFTAVHAISNNANSQNAGTYVGDADDTYIIECTKGGDIDGTPNFPEITVRTARGLDYAGPLQVTASGNTANKFFSIGNKGVKVAFATSSGTAVTQLRKGDKWYIQVTAAASGPVTRLILQHDLPSALVGSNASPVLLDIKLFIKSNIQVSENRLNSPPNKNYTANANGVTLNSNVTAYHPEWTSGGVPQALAVQGGVAYVEYREWLSVLTNTVESISSVSELNAISGPLDPDNPLKWGVYKALLNSNGTAVRYTAVADPANLDEWSAVLERLVGRDDIYNLVPLTFNVDVHNLYIAYVNGESNEIKNNWKGCFVSLRSRTSLQVVGAGAPVGGVAGTAQAIVLATVAAQSGSTAYTLLQSATGQFVTNNVKSGDLVRYGYAVDGFGNETYSEYVVDSVLSENALLLYSGPSAPVSVAQRVEIWHNLNRAEMADDIATRAGALSNRRVVAVWPDQVGSNGTLQPGFFLAAALAGLASGVLPHQGLTNVEVAGFDDYTRSYKLFNETQLDRLAEAGVWIVTEDRSGTPYTRHALTTDNLDLNRREEMIRRNVDSISYLFLRRLRPYIGRTNATPAMVDFLGDRVNDTIRFLASNGYTAELGSQLISGSIRVLRIHPLLKDRIEIVLDLVVPAPLNNIELHLVV